MEYKKYTYEELDKKYLALSEKRDSLMDECAKSGLPFNEYVEKAKDLTEEIYFIRREMRLKETPILDYGKTWKGDTYKLEKFVEMCKSGQMRLPEEKQFYENNGFIQSHLVGNVIPCMVKTL